MSTGELLFVHSFTKKAGEKIQVVLKKFKGKYYVDLRLWFQQSQGQDFLPSRKGVSFELAHLSEFRQGVDQLAKAAADIQNRPERHPFVNQKPMGSTGQRNKLYSAR